MEIETHPFEPFAPADAKILILGTFPPKPIRWSMEFYYPNYINDFWRIMGMIFYGDKERFVDRESRSFRLPDIKAFLTEKGIALKDTAVRARRLRDNASDKFLEIVEPVDLDLLLSLMPECHAIATTGEKAAQVIAAITGTEAPKTGERVEGVTPVGRRLDIYRMPSTSRAYPLALERKAEQYERMFRHAGIL